MAVAAVLWPKHAFLRKVRVNIDDGLSELMDSLKRKLPAKLLAAVMSVKAEHRCVELKRAVRSVERDGAPIDKFVVPLRGAVLAVLRDDESYAQLAIDAGWKEAITKLRINRADWTACFGRWNVPTELQQRILDLFEAYAPGADSVFAHIERASRQKHSEAQLAMATRLRRARVALIRTPTDLPRGAGSEIARLADLMASVATRFEDDARRLTSMQDYFGGFETRGSKNHARAHVIEALASIFEDLTSVQASAHYDLRTESRDSDFVRFLRDVVLTAGLPDWLDGIEVAADRTLRGKEKRTKRA